MFNKLISNLPFNPSLIGQVSFYAKRLHQEASVRRLGFMFMVLAIVVQLFAALAPPQPTLARSGNDIIEGGFTTRDQAVLHCLNQSSDFSTILKYYGIGCDKLADAETVTLSSTDYEGKLDSLGRTPQGPFIERTGKPTDEYQVPIPGAFTPLYMRNLWSWDSGASSTYKLLRMKNSQGYIIMVMYSCGNIVTIDRYTPPVTPVAQPQPVPQTPKLEIKKENAPKDTVNIGDTITYSLLYRNKGNGTATHVRIKDAIPLNTELISIQPGHNKYKISTNRRSLEFWHNVRNEAIGYSDFLHVVRYTVRVTRYPSSSNKICNTAQITSDQESSESNEVCNSVRKPTTTATTPITPSIPQTPVIVPEIPSPAPPPPPPGSPTAPLLTHTKKASNDTRNIADANNTTAQAGDVITYTLIVKNTGNGKADNFVVEENISDVLEYANVVDLNGGSLNKTTGIVRWSPKDIPAGTSIEKKFSVKVKNPIPQTPVSSSHPGSFDLVMSNFYGNTVNIKLPGGVIKRAEMVTTTQLPNTGPGTNLIIGFSIATIIGYFFMRSRLLAKELDLVRADYIAS